MNARKKSLREAGLFLSLFSLCAGLQAAQLVNPNGAPLVDLNGNGMSDVWELVFEAGGLDPGPDADGDGAGNSLEAAAGTNPFSSNSLPRITHFEYTSSNVTLSLPAAPGKYYSLQSLEMPDAFSWSNWVTEAGVLATGAVVTLNSSIAPSAKFFRVQIADVDSDGDGVTDWEEAQVGLNANNPFSNGQLDAQLQPLKDGAYMTNMLARQSVVSVQASEPAAMQPDTGQPATDIGVFTITRGGFTLQPLDVNLGVNSPGDGLGTEGLDFAPLPKTLAFPVGMSSLSVTSTPLANPNMHSPVLATLSVLPGARYSVGAPSHASVVISPSETPSGTGLSVSYYAGASTTYASNINFNPANLLVSRVDPTVDFNWNANPGPVTNNGYYTVRWTGQVQPEYSETYYFAVNSSDGARLWVNGIQLINRWQAQTLREYVGTIDLQAGVRYNFRLEYLSVGSTNAQAHLAWYSPSQVKQIIPSNRLYPAAANAGPTAVVSPISAVAFLGQPFSFILEGANTARYYTAEGLPPGLSLNATNGVISGIPNLAGDFQVSVSASNRMGWAGSVLALRVIDTGSSVSREVWPGIVGRNISDIPLNTLASVTNSLGSLEGITDFGDNYGERIRGYLTAPATGNYYFWIAGSDSAELWISNDQEPVNKVKRVWVSPSGHPAPPPAYGTASRQWNLQANQRSGWLALEAGQRYYLEILHKADSGASDNFAVGWLQDPTGTNTVPAEVVPGYVLSPYYDLPLSHVPGTLYAANMLAQGVAISSGVGSATLRLSADEKSAVLKYHYSGLSAPVTGAHIHNDPYGNKPSQIIFDIDEAPPQPDGSHIWEIVPVGSLTAAEILEILKEGKAYINVHTVNYPAGEIRGNFVLANGARTFTPPPAPPVWVDDHTNANAAARFLIQATFGSSPSEIAAVQSMGYESWIEDQFTRPPSHHLPYVLANPNSNPRQLYPNNLVYNSWWQQSITAPDQLRQRVAFALSQIMVVSTKGVLNNNARALTAYYDLLLNDAFASFRDILETVTLSPAMGLYLDMRRNDKGNIITGMHPNENYAREILQLFSIGLFRQWPDGSLVLDSAENLVPTYDQNVILGYSRVFTGWNYYQVNQANGRLPTQWNPPANYINLMTLVPTHHELGTKLLLDNVVLPAAQGDQADSTKPAYDAYGLQDLDLALDAIFNHQNVGPFICRQLIQRLVTSHPSREYLYRVVQKFNDNGAGVRGDMQAVLKAILLDYEARSSTLKTVPTYGKQREPILRVTAAARAFPVPAPLGGTYAQNGTERITVTTTNVHRLTGGDRVFLEFTTGTPLPTSQGYAVANITSNTFTVNAAGLLTGTYGWTNDVITVRATGHGLTNGWPVYLVFTTGPAVSGQYVVQSVVDTARFTVSAPGTSTNTGNCLFPRLTGGYRQQGTTITIYTSVNHSLNPGDSVYINFTSGTAQDGTYTVTGTPDDTHFTVTATTSANQTQNSSVVFPLVSPPLVRSGDVTLSHSTWTINGTDNDLFQTPLSAPTVFNFYFPDFKFPGTLASAGLTTPEFQLTTDTSLAQQMNFMYGGIETATSTRGFSSFRNGNGAIELDLGLYMTAAYTANANIPTLIEELNTLLLGGQLSAGAKTAIQNYVANTVNFPYDSPSTATQRRNRARAVAHLILTSPDFSIQK